MYFFKPLFILEKVPVKTIELNMDGKEIGKRCTNSE